MVHACWAVFVPQARDLVGTASKHAWPGVCACLGEQIAQFRERERERESERARERERASERERERTCVS